MNSAQPLTLGAISRSLADSEAKLKSSPMPGDMLSGLWLDLSEDLKEPEPLLKQGDVNVLTRGNFSCIIGQAKSRKTFLISAITGAFLGEDEFIGFEGTTDTGTVLYFDTEQSRPHVMKVIGRIHRIAGFNDQINHERLRVLCLRELRPEDRIKAIRQGMELVKPTLCVIDGVADLMADTNSNTEAVSIATMLLQLTSQYDCHILTVIHTNPGGDKARGHIGSEIIRKAETVMHVAKDEQTSKVTAAYCRDMEFQDFAFVINDRGFPELSEVPATTPKIIELTNLFSEILPLPKTETYNTLKGKIIEHLECAEKTARRRIKDAIDTGVIVKNDVGYYHMKHKSVDNDETLPF